MPQKSAVPPFYAATATSTSEPFFIFSFLQKPFPLRMSCNWAASLSMLLIRKRDSISNDARNNPTSINSCPSRSQKVFFLIPFKATPATTAPIPRRRWLPFPGLDGGPLCHSTTQNPFLFFWLKGITKKNVSTFVQKRIIICISIAERDSQQQNKV